MATLILSKQVSELNRTISHHDRALNRVREVYVLGVYGRRLSGVWKPGKACWGISGWCLKDKVTDSGICSAGLEPKVRLS